MSKSFYSLGLMSGTSMDGVDVSIINSDGSAKFKGILNKYFEYSEDLHKNLISSRDKINNSKDLKAHSKELDFLQKEITLFHSKAVNEVVKEILGIGNTLCGHVLIIDALKLTFRKVKLNKRSDCYCNEKKK